MREENTVFIQLLTPKTNKSNDNEIICQVPVTELMGSCRYEKQNRLFLFQQLCSTRKHPRITTR